MASAGYDVLGRVEGATCASGTVKVEGMCTALDPASYGCSPFVAIRAPAYASLMQARYVQLRPAWWTNIATIGQDVTAQMRTADARCPT